MTWLVVTLYVITGILGVLSLVIFVNLPNHRIDIPNATYAEKYGGVFDSVLERIKGPSVYDAKGRALLYCLWACQLGMGAALLAAMLLLTLQV